MSTSKEDIENEIRFIKLVASRYAVLRPLYPDNKISFMNLAQISGVGEANLSRYLKALDEEGLVIIETVNENVSRPYSVIGLSNDVKRIIERVIALKGQNAEPALLSEVRYLDEALSYIMDPGAQGLAADQIQIISRNTIVPANSEFFDYLSRNLLDEKLSSVRSVLLLSLQNILRNSSYVSRQKIAEKILPNIRTIKKTAPRERSSILATDILDEFYQDDASYEVLSQEYIDGVISGTVDIYGSRRRLVERFPDKKIDLRSRLLKIFSTASPEVRERIESEFITLY